MEPSDSMTLQQLQRTVQRLLTVAALRDVWVTAELSDVRVAGGHCYMELLQKNDAGAIVAKARAAIWASVYRGIAYNFRAVTGQEFATGLKVMLRVTVSYHEVYGMTLVVNDVNPEFTMGDLLRRRRENLLRLQREGIINDNRQLQLPPVVLRVAVISARGAAGFGDFVNQLAGNASHLAFKVKLFPARLQGEGTPASIISALERISDEYGNWDCVVLIRGGGASSDLIAFEDYDLAAAVAQFPLPVIIGIGHERDVTLLDYVAHMRVKTPTAAAEWLISLGDAALDRLRSIAVNLAASAGDRMTGTARQLSSIEAQLSILPGRAVERAASGLRRSAAVLGGLGTSCILPMRERLLSMSERLMQSPSQAVARQRDLLESHLRLLDALSPEATMRRGFTVTRINGHAAYSATEISSGDTITTYFADGTVVSTVNQNQNGR